MLQGKLKEVQSLTGFVRDRSRFQTVDNWEQSLGPRQYPV